VATGLDQLITAAGSVAAASSGRPAPEAVAAWRPEPSGDLPIRIRSDGTWEHEGREIQRESLWRLFAALLRREGDGEYYLVTPVEKWRIEVEGHALVAVDLDRIDDMPGGPRWLVRLNSGDQYFIGGERRLQVPPEVSEPSITLPNGLSARLTRAAWYRLVDSAACEGDELVIYSGGERIGLGRLATG
jgi:hypothetical protein